MLEQLARRQEVLRAGARHVGWKIGQDEADSVDGAIGVGYITSVSCLEPGETYDAAGTAVDLRADVEVAVELGRDLNFSDGDAAAAIAGYATALEIVDVSPVLTSPEAAISTNDTHRAVAVGCFRPTLPAGTLCASALVNGEPRERRDAEVPLEDRLTAAARVLESVGQRLRQGDWIITGVIVQTSIAPGDAVEGVIDGLGAVRLDIA
jgi:2-keto-4-pentenoate hydratase